MNESRSRYDSPSFVRSEEPLSAHTSLRTGGCAAFWGEVKSREELDELLQWAEHESLEVVVLGLGSNVLFADEGFPGVVIRLGGAFTEVTHLEYPSDLGDHEDHEALLQVGAALPNAQLVRYTWKQGWVGAEFLALIPGTMGGAVIMNAGIKGADLASILVSVEVLRPNEKGSYVSYQREVIPADALHMAYRDGNIPKGAIVLSATLRVRTATPDDLKQADQFVRSQREHRNQTQPYRLASVGSTFANPPGDYAGRLIEQVGLKGFSIGNAQISEHHANFFVNCGGASSQDLIALINQARCRVWQATGLVLKPEVRLVGFKTDPLWYPED